MMIGRIALAMWENEVARPLALYACMSPAPRKLWNQVQMIGRAKEHSPSLLERAFPSMHKFMRKDLQIGWLQPSLSRIARDTLTCQPWLNPKPLYARYRCRHRHRRHNHHRHRHS